MEGEKSYKGEELVCLMRSTVLLGDLMGERGDGGNVGTVQNFYKEMGVRGRAGNQIKNKGQTRLR